MAHDLHKAEYGTATDLLAPTRQMKLVGGHGRHAVRAYGGWNPHSHIHQSRGLVSIRSGPRHAGGRQSDDTVSVFGLPVQPGDRRRHLSGHFGMHGPFAFQQTAVDPQNVDALARMS